MVVVEHGRCVILVRIVERGRSPDMDEDGMSMEERCEVGPDFFIARGSWNPSCATVFVRG